MKCVVTLQLFFAVLTVLQLHCSEGVTVKENEVPLDYLAKVRKDIADQEGIPKDLDTAPTIIHCLQEKGAKLQLLLACMCFVFVFLMYFS